MAELRPIRTARRAASVKRRAITSAARYVVALRRGERGGQSAAKREALADTRKASKSSAKKRK